MHYAPASVVMIEDHKQLKSTVLSCEGSSEQFVAQMIMSFFTQLV
jgi:superfamily I DNA and/or RNA helicase